MQDFLLYCDFSTMLGTAQDIEKELRKLAWGFVRVNDSVWIVRMSKYTGSYLRTEEFLFIECIEKYTNDDSFVYITRFGEDEYYNLPLSVVEFLDHPPRED